MLMVETKHRRVRLGVATPSPVPSPGPGLASSSSELKSSEEWNEMRPSQLGRIDVLQLKAEIVKRIGSERADRYFSHFRSFISSRVSKQELDKLVLLTIGKENVALHNQLVKAILCNAVRAQEPPSLPSQDVSKRFKRTQPKPLSFICNEEAASQAPNLSNGDSVVRSPRRGRLHMLRDHVDRPSPLGSHEENVTDLSRPMQQSEGVTKQQEAESSGGGVPPLKRLRVSQPVTAGIAIALECKTSAIRENSITKEDWREQNLRPAGGFAQELLGKPFCSGSVSTVRKPTLCPYPAPLLIQELSEYDSVDATDLPDAELTHKRMEEIAAAEGLEMVRRDCADLLTNALDLFLGRLIKSCVDVVGSRRVDDGRPVLSGPLWEKNAMSNSSTLKSPRSINGVWSGSSVDFSRTDKDKIRPAISLTDFKVAMDLVPQQLGQDWPVQLEKISFRLLDQ